MGRKKAAECIGMTRERMEALIVGSAVRFDMDPSKYTVEWMVEQGWIKTCSAHPDRYLGGWFAPRNKAARA
jgi:hypothetical protein